MTKSRSCCSPETQRSRLRYLAGTRFESPRDRVRSRRAARIWRGSYVVVEIDQNRVADAFEVQALARWCRVQLGERRVRIHPTYSRRITKPRLPKAVLSQWLQKFQNALALSRFASLSSLVSLSLTSVRILCYTRGFFIILRALNSSKHWTTVKL